MNHSWSRLLFTRTDSLVKLYRAGDIVPFTVLVIVILSAAFIIPAHLAYADDPTNDDLTNDDLIGNESFKNSQVKDTHDQDTYDQGNNDQDDEFSGAEYDDDEYNDDEFDDAEFDAETKEGFYYEDAFSGDDYSDTRPFISIDALLGGQTLEKIEFENGEVDKIRAGSGVSFSLGIAHLMFEKRVDVGIKAGYLFDLITAKNSDGDESVLSFTRIPIDIFSHYWAGRHIWGGGLTAHLDPKFTSRETTDDARYHTAYGAYIEYLFHFTGTGSSLGVKFLNINYKNKKTNDVSDGSSLGITFSQMF